MATATVEEGRAMKLTQRKAHIFIRFVADHYRPDSRPAHVYVIKLQD
jgi:hypothetical protein